MLKIAFHPSYILPIPERHRFPMQKYAKIAEKLVESALVESVNFFVPEKARLDQLILAHDKSYVNRLLALTLDEKMVRRIGFEMSRELIDRELYLVDGTIRCCAYAIEHGVSFNVAGGTHHAGYDFGEGFCLLNDQAIAAATLADRKIARQILVIDLDVHQGNGTAHIFENNKFVFTFSMHAQSNYPFIKRTSDLDIGLEDDIQDELYLSILKENLSLLFDKVMPDFVFYQAGVDVLATDKLGRLSMSRDGCRRRDEMVFDFCRTREVPVQVSMGGGYSVELDDIVEAHINTYREAIRIFGL